MRLIMVYTKTIAGRQVFSNCTTIQNEDGTWISNPTEEQIEAAGWTPYVPPVVPQTEPGIDEIIAAVKKMLSTESEALSDEDALAVAAIFPTWISKVGLPVAVGERLWYDEKLYRVIQEHTVQAEWTPGITPALFTEVSIEEWPEIPENIPSENPWMKGDKGTWKGQHYICQMDNCVWNPDQYPAAWEIVA